MSHIEGTSTVQPLELTEAELSLIEELPEELLGTPFVENAAADDEVGTVPYDRAAHLEYLSNFLKSITPEQRQAMMKKAEETRRLKREYAEKHYTYVWADDKVWRMMAKQAGVRLADQYTSPTAYNLAKFAKALGLESWKEGLFGIIASKGVTYCLKEEFDRQPEGRKLNLRAYQGALLEMKYGATFKNTYHHLEEIDDEEQVA